MNRRDFVRATGMAPIAAGAQHTPGSRPNILLICGDNQQADTIANRSVCRTPNINRLASQGMLFHRAYTNAAVCCPARNALLTGAFNWRFGTYNHVDQACAVSNDPFPDVVTYPAIMREGGYRLGYCGKWHTSTIRIPTDFGFHEIGAPDRYKGIAREKLIRQGWLQIEHPRRRTPVRKVRWPGTTAFGLWGYSEGEVEETELYQTAQAGIEMIKRFSTEGKPWHVEVHFPEAFRAWPLRRYRERYEASAIPVASNFHDPLDGKPNMQRREADSYGSVTDGDFQDGRAFYYASYEQMDEQVGRILDALAESGQAANTVVVFTSDHGAPWGAHRMWLPCFAPYEETYKIPMVVRWPGYIEPGSACHRLAQFHDLGHTFLDIAGLRPLPHPHGVSLRPLFQSPTADNWRDMILCPWYGQDFLMIQRMVISETHKFAFNAFDFDECYDLESDPGELTNLVPSTAHRAVVDDMRARLYELMARFDDPYGDHGTAVTFMAPRYLDRGKRMA